VPVGNASSGRHAQWAYVVARVVTRSPPQQRDVQRAECRMKRDGEHICAIVPGAATHRSGNRGLPLAALNRPTADGLLRRRPFHK